MIDRTGLEGVRTDAQKISAAVKGAGVEELREHIVHLATLVDILAQSCIDLKTRGSGRTVQLPRQGGGTPKFG